MRIAERLLEHMLEIGLSLSHITYNALMEGYCTEGSLKGTFKLREVMEKERKHANVVTYNILLKGVCRKGKLENTNGLLNEMLEKGLLPMKPHIT
ncbi:hypothetical protein MLD38_017804 [Melastoma candidum]|uniref:Uncharacterized protein n=1 Tax=Melastoma candidum TaxID=119954 RepID=A0ACB9QRS4_9MYRT|nr:hypothetical protein MLD38_017804 [Melastoma candidum]